MQPLLTIGIPTFNSLDTLVQALKSIQDQNFTLRKDIVEIYVSDNSSNYDLPFELARIFESEFYDKITINVNDENIGYDNNLVTIFQNSKGKYVKLLADDDLLELNFLSAFFEYINSLMHDPVIIITNFVFKSSDLSATINASWYDKAAQFEDNNVLKSLNQLNHAYGQVSSLIFKRESVLSISKQLLNTNYIHVYWFFCLIETGIVEIVSESLVVVRQGAPNWSGYKSIDILTPLGGILAIEQSNLGNVKLKNDLINQQLSYCFSRLTAIHSQELLERLSIFSKFYPYAYRKIVFWVFWGPWILLPKSVRVFLKKIRKTLVKIKLCYFGKEYS
jgi:glycosyltransferase involved in cell wall biosynthesis